jgi:hypothetical protein
MTPDERNLLQRFLQDLVQTRGVTKDAEAAAMIDQALRSSPDAGYVLVQHAILSDQALHAAQDQIASLQAQLQGGGGWAPTAQNSSFLPAGPSPWSQPSASRYVGSGPFNSGGGLGSFLRTAGTMAAGVAGGDLLFEGISNLFGGGDRW